MLMRVSIFVGDVADADADAICTSTNPRLSLVMGTGASVRERGGFDVLRACESILRDHQAQMLPPGSAYATTAGRLPHKVAIHCVASDAAHRSSDSIIRSCVISALRCADEHQCRSVAMPVFGTGHAHAEFRPALEAMAEGVCAARTSVEHVVFVILDPDRVEVAQEVLSRLFVSEVAVIASDGEAFAPASWLSDDDDYQW